MQWIDFPDERFVVNGLGWWDETKPVLRRLPERMQSLVRPPVWDLAQSPSAGRIRFATDATDLAIHVRYPSLRFMTNMPRVGQLGIDLWVDGEYWRPVYPLDETSDYTGTFFEGLSAKRREICMYLGLYAPVEVLAIGLNEGASIEPPAPFALEKPIVYYGTSITQGGCASRAGMAYQAEVGRALNLDYINLGFSGNGKGEKELAEACAEIDACCYVMDFCQNNRTAAELQEVYAPFLQTIRDRRPDTPIVCITTIFSTAEVWNPASEHEKMREVIRKAVADRSRAGDRKIGLVEGYDLLGPDHRIGLVDATHPNDIGFMMMADGLTIALGHVLGLRGKNDAVD